MDTDERISRGVEINGINRAGACALAAADTEALTDNDTPTFAVCVSARGAGLRAWSDRIAGKTVLRLESGGQPAGGPDADTGLIP